MRARNKKIFLPVIAFLFVCFLAEWAGAERPPFKIYTTEEGLAHDSVNKIVRDSHGFLWFCTAEGLSRFDGYKFKNYTQDHGLPHRNVNDFLETADGAYLVATNLGISSFNPNGKAYRWNVLDARLEQTSDEAPLFQTFAPESDNRLKKSVISLAEDKSGRIWAGTAIGLFRVEKSGTQWKLQEFEVDKPATVGFPTLLADSKGGLLVGSDAGVYRISPEASVEKIENRGASSILEDRDGRIWIDSGGNPLGLGVYELENGKYKRAKSYTTKDGLSRDVFFYALFQMSDGRIYVGLDNGLCEFLPSAAEGEPSFRLLNSDKVTSMAEDSAGNLWFGTELKGAWKLVRGGFSSFGESDGISPLLTLESIFTNKTDEVFIITRPQKILHLVDGKFESILPHGVTGRSWGWNFLDFQSIDDEWWVASIDGLRRYPAVKNFADLEHTPPRKIYTKADGLFSNQIFNIFEDSRGDVWITIIGGGEDVLSRRERKTEKIFSYTSADGLPKSNGSISFAEDAHGNVWLGNYFGTLLRYRNGKFELFTAKEGLPESQIDDLLIDSDKRLWIATIGRGLFRVDDTNAEKPVFTSISTADGISSNQIICLTEDRFKRIYAGTGRGINRIEPNGNIKVFTQDDGLPSNYVTRCAADKKGNLWFVSQNTLVRFIPEIENTPVPPTVFIDKISVNGVPQKISELGETKIAPLELASDQRQIQIDFFALTFGTGKNIRYQYRLNNNAWSNPTEQQTLNLDLAPGRHDFAVRTIRGDNAASEAEATVSINILSPLWQRWWFIAVCALFVTGAILLLYRYRTANLREINLALEDLRKSREDRIAELEKVRARIATDLHDDIGASLTEIAVLSEVAQTQSKSGNGAVAQPLQLITNVSNELVETMSDIVWSINPAKDHMRDLTQRMRRFASDILWAKGINLQFTAPDAEKELTINANVRREVFLIFKESVNNIVKHSGARHVSVDVHVSGEDLWLKISDDGRGFQASANVENKTFSEGNGLLNMKKRAAEMNGDFEILSKPGKGATVNLRLPLEGNSKI